MSLPVGTRVGAYEIRGALGAGGMGEVYRARDTKLDRDVALKILPALFADDPERLARFEREAKTLAALNHPHIGAIYGLEASRDTQPPLTALVLELVEGPTLADLIARGPLSLDETLPIARQIAEAVEAAHEAGVVHRDLKPANIKVRPDGTVKVLDFGLAKAIRPQDVDSTTALTNSPTLTNVIGLTEAGLVLGTAAYMAPEQAKGRPVDRRVDVWAFGCVLFEMLAGRPAFEGDDVTEILGSIVKLEPAWSSVPRSTPPSIVTLLQRCLRKDRTKRLQHIGDARIEIVDAESRPDEPVAGPPEGTPRWLPWTLLGVSAVITAGLAIPAGRYLRQPPAPELPEMRFEIATPSTFEPRSFAISPDGNTLVFVAMRDKRSVLWRRRLDTQTAEPLTGTENAFLPFWSPDSRSLGFFAEGKLRRLDIGTGAIRDITNAPSPNGGTWNQDGVILLGPISNSPIVRVSADGGGEVTPVTELGASIGHRYPAFLPDGRTFTYWSFDPQGNSKVHVTRLGSSETKPLMTADGGATFMAPATLFFAEDGILYGQQFDPSRLELLGGRYSLGARAAPNAIGAFGQSVSTSLNGTLIYREAGLSDRLELVWFDRTGRHDTSLPNLTLSGTEVELSPDGRRGAFIRRTEGNNDVWLFDVSRGVASRFTTALAPEIWPVWSPDGGAVAFQREQRHIYSKSLSGEEKLLLEQPQGAVIRPADWSRDGRFLLYQVAATQDLWALPLQGSDKPFPIVESRFSETRGQFSPDGQWISYESDESGRPEVYVRAFNRPAPPVRISIAGGIEARWHPSGRQLFFIDPEANLMVVDVAPAAEAMSIKVSSPQRLFGTNIFRGGNQPPNFKFQYAVSADGSRFLINQTQPDEAPSPLTIVLNWKPPK